jgi:hypothetical protein
MVERRRFAQEIADPNGRFRTVIAENARNPWGLRILQIVDAAQETDESDSGLGMTAPKIFEEATRLYAKPGGFMGRGAVQVSREEIDSAIHTLRNEGLLNGSRTDGSTEIEWRIRYDEPVEEVPAAPTDRL